MITVYISQIVISDKMIISDNYKNFDRVLEINTPLNALVRPFGLMFILLNLKYRAHVCVCA